MEPKPLRRSVNRPLEAVRFNSVLIVRFRKDEIMESDLKFLMLEGDKRKDLILAFRVIRKTPNGSVTILWKELQQNKAPEIVFQKEEKLMDIKPDNYQ